MSRVLMRLFSVLIAILGGSMSLGGVLLAVHGGSLYYLPTGLALLMAAVQLWRLQHSGLSLLLAILLVTVCWSIYEVGFDPWLLLPRLLMPSVLALWLLIPWSRKALRGAHPAYLRPVPMVLAFIVSLAVGGALFYGFAELPDDPRFQTGIGTFPGDATGVTSAEVGVDWPYFGGDRGGSRFSPLSQIRPDNVSRLVKAWEVDVGQLPTTSASPIKIGSTLYTCDNNNGVYALDAASGLQRWYFDASDGHGGPCRGVAWWRSASGKGVCGERILTATSAAQLIALDAHSGELCPEFGNGGRVDLSVGMGDSDGHVIGGYYKVTSAPQVVRSKIVIGGWVTDNQYWGEPSGVIRAFDALTGEFVWAWDVGNPGISTQPPAGQQYTHSTPNSWAPMSADEERGLVFLPTGNASGDLYGALRRPFDDAFSSSVVALHADTGALAWSFQTIHHDLWDHDVAAQPTLAYVRTADGRQRPAVIQAAKNGEIFVLDRDTGEPIHAVEEVAVPQSGAVPEERLSPTQPRSVAMPSFRGRVLREADMWGVSPLDQLYCRIKFRQARYEGLQTPPGLTPSIQYPATFGSINWGGVALDPTTGVMIVNSNLLANYVQLITRDAADALGMRRVGAYAKGRELAGGGPHEGTPYAALRPYWLTALGVPCTAPPYGFISAVSIHTGKLLWSHRFGTAKGSGPLGFGFPFEWTMGVPNHGGSLITASGLVFSGATRDNLFSVFDQRSGDLLWRTELPGGGSSAPISYSVDGRQFVVLHAGGNGALGSRFSTKMVAFSLPLDQAATTRVGDQEGL